ncbi:MAG: HAD family hydrolase [Pseudomonadota bacterium]
MRAVLFDLDETLFDRTGSLKLFLADQHARHEMLQAWMQPVYVDRFLQLDRRGMVAKAIVYSALLEEIGDCDPAFAAALLREYEQKLGRFARSFAGAHEVLADLRSRQLRLGIVTNGRTSMQTSKIADLDLQDRVDTILISEAEGVRKPNAEIFLRAAANLDVQPDACLFVGDNPLADILGARAVGMRTVWFPNGAGWPDDCADAPGDTIKSLTELIAIVESSPA